MKFLCPECERLINLEQYRLEGADLVVTCPKCGAEARATPAPPTADLPLPAPRPSASVSAPRVSLASSGASNVVVLRTASHEAVARAAQAADSGPFVIPDGVCPKCIAPRAQAEACPHCGIRFEAFDEATVLPPKWLRDEWVELLRDWSNEGRHVQLRRKAQQVDALAAVGRLYRLRRSAVAEDPFAAEGLADILRLAAVPMAIPREEDDAAARRTRVVLGSVVAVVGLAVIVLAVKLMLSLGAQ